MERGVSAGSNNYTSLGPKEILPQRRFPSSSIFGSLSLPQGAFNGL
uniref:Uncharacterized protein n=1 Tax=Anguilla anguilla TaxID=7936 RepID=A0A0E9WMT2_ANGAN